MPDPNREKVYYPPFMGSWDRFEQNQATGDGRVLANQSYLDATSKISSKLIARNHDALDVDIICVRRETGYLVRFKTLRTGILQVKADLQNCIATILLSQTMSLDGLISMPRRAVGMFLPRSGTERMSIRPMRPVTK